jgi:hypothetical protein
MNLDNWWLNAVWSLAPTIGVGLIFWFIVRSIIRADRTERTAYAKIEKIERARLAATTALPPATTDEK